MRKQIDYAAGLDNYNGYALYNYISLFQPDSSCQAKAESELSAISE